MPRPRLEAAPWWPEFLEVKDEYPLKVLAERYGVSINGLSRALKRAGIERPIVRKPRGSLPDVGRKHDPRSAEAQEWWPEFLSLKDKKPLAELAEKFEVAEITLQRALKRTGETRKSQRGARGNRKAKGAARKLASLSDQVGVLPDAEVATLAGVSKYAVAQYRKKKGIPAVRGGRPPSKAPARPRTTPAPRRVAASAPPPTPASVARPAPVLAAASPAPVRAASASVAASPLNISLRGEAFVARFKCGDAEEKLVVVGRDLVDAALQAQQAVTAEGWRLEGLEFVGLAL